MVKHISPVIEKTVSPRFLAHRSLSTVTKFQFAHHFMDLGTMSNTESNDSFGIQHGITLIYFDLRRQLRAHVTLTLKRWKYSVWKLVQWVRDEKGSSRWEISNRQQLSCQRTYGDDLTDDDSMIQSIEMIEGSFNFPSFREADIERGSENENLSKNWEKICIS